MGSSGWSFGMPDFLLPSSLPQKNSQGRRKKNDFPCGCPGGMSPVHCLRAFQMTYTEESPLGHEGGAKRETRVHRVPLPLRGAGRLGWFWRSAAIASALCQAVWRRHGNTEGEWRQSFILRGKCEIIRMRLFCVGQCWFQSDSSNINISTHNDAYLNILFQMLKCFLISIFSLTF